MKIDQFYSNYSTSNYKTQEERKQGAVEGKTVGKTTVEISEQAKALVKRIGESEDAQFSEKVEGLRRSIQEGRYQVSPEKLTDKILERIEVERKMPSE